MSKKNETYTVYEGIVHNKINNIQLQITQSEFSINADFNEEFSLWKM